MRDGSNIVHFVEKRPYCLVYVELILLESDESWSTHKMYCGSNIFHLFEERLRHSILCKAYSPQTECIIRDLPDVRQERCLSIFRERARKSEHSLQTKHGSKRLQDVWLEHRILSL